MNDFADKSDEMGKIDISKAVLQVEALYNQFMDDLEECGYCSPYVDCSTSSSFVKCSNVVYLTVNMFINLLLLKWTVV